MSDRHVRWSYSHHVRQACEMVI